mmetsp:Transcript_13406/g.20964  ORF Transcript_13406/g.20964 Transcript_13406/m.20964 type:complete len:139 (-) Transcript_13406:2226-2642(-)
MGGQAIIIIYLLLWIVAIYCLIHSMFYKTRALYVSIIAAAFRNTLPLLGLAEEHSLGEQTSVLMVMTISRIVGAVYFCIMISYLFIPYKWIYVSALFGLAYYGMLKWVSDQEGIEMDSVFLSLYSIGTLLFQISFLIS